MSKKLVVIIDVQNDFVSGTLGFEKANDVVSSINKRMNEWLKDDEVVGVIYTQDTHYNNYLETREGRYLPIEHCIKGTWGHEIVDDVMFEVNNKVILEKETFASPMVGDVVKEMCEANPEIDEIVVMGLVSDICVLSNIAIISGQHLEKDIVVYMDSTNTADDKKHEAMQLILNSWQIEVR